VTWVNTHADSIPAVIVVIVTAFASLQQDLVTAKSKVNALLQQWCTAVGILPSSEKGPKPPKLKMSDQEKVAQLKERRKKLNKSIRRYEERLGKLRVSAVKRRNDQKAQEASGMSPDASASPSSTAENLVVVIAEPGSLASPVEDLFSGNLCDDAQQTSRLGVDRVKQFDNPKGLHSSVDDRRRHEYVVTTRTMNLEVETVTDPRTGKSVTASTDHIGPPNSQATWTAIANTVISVVGYAIPANRLAKMLKGSNPYFTTARLLSFLEYAASLFEEIYAYLGESLSDAEWVLGDDTKTRVVELSRAQKNGDDLSAVDPESRIGRMAELFGRLFPRKKGKGNKKQLNVSVVIGKTNAADVRSYVYFFRTHFGSFGDLVSKMLEVRDPKKKDFTIVSDLSTTNLVAPEFYKKFNISHAGCGSHARRPFWRYKDTDQTLCYWMLSAFLILQEIEDKLDHKGRTIALVTKYRQKYAKKIWAAILKRCVSVVKGEAVYGSYWPKTSKIYDACAYIKHNYEELTRYLDDPRLPSTNNLSERVLRWDKIMQDSSKFRMTENGRLNIDILRTIVHTCSAAQVDLKAYLYFVFQHRQEIAKDPSKYTPYAFALSKK